MSEKWAETSFQMCVDLVYQVSFENSNLAKLPLLTDLLRLTELAISVHSDLKLNSLAGVISIVLKGGIAIICREAKISVDVLRGLPKILGYYNPTSHAFDEVSMTDVLGPDCSQVYTVAS